MGTDSAAVATRVKVLLEPIYTVQLYGVPYSNGIKPAFDGTAERQLEQQVSLQHRKCPLAALVVIGQSQGAAVVHQAVHAIIPPVAAAILLGDPQHHPNAPYNRGPGPNDGVGAWPTGPGNDIRPEQYDRVASYCLANDAVCGNGPAYAVPNNQAHEEYRNDKDGVATNAAHFAANWVKQDHPVA
jgi:hypothetical protein